MDRIFCKKGKELVRIICSGNATMEYSVKAKNLFKTIVSGENVLCEIDLSELSNTDISFVELLISFKISMERNNRVLSFKNLPENHNFLSFLSQGGIRSNIFFAKDDRHAF